MVYIRRLNARTDYFRKLVGRMILMDNRTRWNSWYNIFLILLKLKRMVEKYYEDYENNLEENLFYVD